MAWQYRRVESKRQSRCDLGRRPRAAGGCCGRRASQREAWRVRQGSGANAGNKTSRNAVAPVVSWGRTEQRGEAGGIWRREPNWSVAGRCEQRSDASESLGAVGPRRGRAGAREKRGRGQMLARARPTRTCWSANGRVRRPRRCFRAIPNADGVASRQTLRCCWLCAVASLRPPNFRGSPRGWRCVLAACLRRPVLPCAVPRGEEQAKKGGRTAQPSQQRRAST